MPDHSSPGHDPVLLHATGRRARLLARLYAWGGAAIAWTVLITSFVVASLAWYGLHALLSRWVPLPKVLAHPMVMVGVVLVLAITNVDRLQRLLAGLSRVLDDWIPGLITLAEGEFALGRWGARAVELRAPGTYLLRAGIRIWFQGTQDEYDHFDPMAQ